MAAEYVRAFNGAVYPGMSDKDLQAHSLKVYNEQNRVKEGCLAEHGYAETGKERRWLYSFGY